jgi:hypothetical protein
MHSDTITTPEAAPNHSFLLTSLALLQVLSLLMELADDGILLLQNQPTQLPRLEIRRPIFVWFYHLS